MRDTHIRDSQAPHGEPDAGLHSRTPGSCPEPKADAQPLSHPGILEGYCFSLLTWAVCKATGHI